MEKAINLLDDDNKNDFYNFVNKKHPLVQQICLFVVIRKIYNFFEVFLQLFKNVKSFWI